MNEYGVIGVLYTAFQTALLSCVRYWLYQDSLRVSAKRMYVAMFSINMAGALIWVLTGGVPGFPFSYVRIITAGFMYALSCFVIMEPFSKHTYTYSFIMAYDLAVEITASFVQLRLLPGSRDWVFALTALALIAITFVPSVRYLKRMIARLSVPGNDGLWKWQCVIIFSFVFMNLLFTYSPMSAPSFRDLLSRYLMMLGVIGLYAATTRAVETMREAAEAKAELGMIKKRVDMQESYYLRLVEQMDEVKRMRHDLRHHWAAISLLVENGDMDALARYIDAAAVRDDALPVTGNLAADSMLLYYTDAARRLGANIETDITIAGKTPVSDPDLCVILGNLLENAVEAQSSVDLGERYIRVRASSNENSLTLAVDNRYSGRVRRDGAGEIITSKTGEGHGMGLDSVRVVCEKYGGILQIDIEGDMFMAGVVIGL